MRRIAVWLYRLFWLVAITTVLGVGAIVALGRYYAPLLERHTDRVVALVNERTGLQLEARAIRAEWRLFAPRVALSGLTLRDPATGAAVAGIDQLRFRIELGASLRQLTPVLSGIAGSGLFVVLEEEPLGRWQLRGLPVREAQGGGALGDLLLAIRSARLDDSRLELRFFNGGRAELHGAARLERAGNFRRLLLAATVSDDSAPLELTLEARGDPRDSDRFRAQGFAQFNGLDLAPILPLAQNLGIDLRHGRIDGRAWLTRERGGSLTLRGELGVPAVDLAALTGRDLPPVSNLRAEFVLQERPGERQLWLPVVAAEWGDAPIRIERLWARQRGSAPDQLEVALPEMDLAAVAGWLGRDGVLPPAWQTALAALAPSGQLQAVRATLPLTRAARDRFGIRARMMSVAVQPWLGAPGIAGATGYGEIDLDGGRAWLDTPALALHFPTIYPAPLRLEQARGRVDWHFSSDDGSGTGRRVLVQSNALDARMGDSHARARFGLDLPMQGAAAVPPHMTLNVGMRNGSPAIAHQLIPQTLSPELRSWLRAAELTGTVPHAGFIYRGSLRAGDDAARTVQLFLDIADGALAFDPAWPALQGIRGQLWLDDAALVAQAETARMYEALALRDVEVALTPLARGSELRAAAAASGVGDDWLRLLRETPLADAAGTIADRLRWEGPAAATVRLALPLGSAPGASAAEAAVEVKGVLDSGTLRLDAPALAVEQVAGSFSYRQGRALDADAPPPGLVAPALSGRLHHRPVRAAITTGADGTIAATVDTTLAVRDWRHLLPLEAPWLEGLVPLRGEVRWRERRGELTLRSNLIGLALNLPAPYRKTPEELLPLTVRLRNASPDTAPDATLDARALNAQARGEPLPTRRAIARTRLEAELGDWLRVALDWGDERLRRGLVRLGPDDAHNATARTGAVVITGAVAAIDVAAWRPHVENIRNSGGQVSGGVQGPNGLDELAITIAGLRTPSVALGNYRLDDVRLDGARLGDRWVLQATSAQASGELILPRTAGAVPRLQLAELRLPPLQTPGPDERGDTLAGLQPAQLPALDFHVERLLFGDEVWGSLGFELRPQRHGAVFGALSGELRGIALGARPDEPARLIWTRLGDAHRTRLDARLGVADIGRVMERFGFERAIVSRRGHLDLAVAWPGSPAAFGFAALDGAAALDLRDGRFLRAPGGTTGALKVVGIFNLANLVRRLRLDFTDFFSDGISFDDIGGSFSLTEGRLTTVRPLEVTSPSSRFRLGGALDFASASVDMELVVTLPLASNLPWVAAVAGGLPAAAGVYIASKLFGEKVDRYSSAVYQVEGPWQEPVIRFRRIFDEAPQPAPASTAETRPAKRKPPTEAPPTGTPPAERPLPQERPSAEPAPDEPPAPSAAEE